MMRQSQRVRIFAGGFLIGCVIAAGIAFLRNAHEGEEELARLPSFQRIVPPPPLPADLPFEAEKAFSAWQSAERGETRWLVQDPSGKLWRISLAEGPLLIYRGDEIQVDGNPGIEPPALRAGLEHNEFEILSFDPLKTIFTVRINPFGANSIEESVRLLESRAPYILGASPIPHGVEKMTRLDAN